MTQDGMSFAGWWSGAYDSMGSDRSLELLAETGADWVSIIVTGYQEKHTSTVINRTGPATPTDQGLIRAIRKAHELGLRVMLKPHVDIEGERETGIWRGYIGTEFSGEAEWREWFSAYTEFILHYARIASTEGVEQFCTGTELLGTSHREVDWRAVVTSVRAVYSGSLVYAALHSGEDQAIEWWDAVDYIGVDAYYPLAGTDWSEEHPDPGLSELKQRWQEPIRQLAALSEREGKPILLTEIGYRSHHGCSKHPWDSWAVSSLDLKEQANAYRAALESLYYQPWLAGMFWWQWFPDPYISGHCDDSFSPQGKPAEAVLREWYGGAPVCSEGLLPDNTVVMRIYTDGLGQGWQNWSWDAELSLADSTTAVGGSASLSATLGPWGAVSLRHEPLDLRDYRWLQFWVKVEDAARTELQVFVQGVSGTGLVRVPISDCRHVTTGRLTDGQWQLVRIPLGDLNPWADHVEVISIQDATGHGTAKFWIDDLVLIGASVPAVRLFLPIAVGP